MSNDDNVELKFVCKTDGEIPQDLVSLLCNKCGKGLKLIGGRWMCKECFKSSAKLECRLCHKRDVKMTVIKK